MTRPGTFMPADAVDCEIGKVQDAFEAFGTRQAEARATMCFRLMEELNLMCRWVEEEKINLAEMDRVMLADALQRTLGLIQPS